MIKNKFKYVLITLLVVLISSAFSISQKADNQIKTWEDGNANGYAYKYITNDPTHTRFYRLSNGLTVILSPSNKVPRIQTYIAVKAGSKTDPATHTGLAHYLEHMLFKGTDKFGSLDYAQEKPLLDEIERLYEQYNTTTDIEERKRIYAEIDKTSGEAAKYAIANEYDKMMAAMGAEGTNAFTSVEETVYTEDIPSNVIDKYLAVQAERFRNPVFRIFHTELEAVYEEKNRGLDDDGNKVFEEMFRLLFQNNNYGRQTTIGTIEHLKNPSLVEIRKYFNTYYVPNNMGIIMSGDFNPDEVIQKIDKAFGYMEPKELPVYTFEPEQETAAPIVSEVWGPQPERILLGYRLPGAATKDAQLLELVGSILTNGSAGLIDLNLIGKQKLLSAYAYPYVMKDYSTLLLGGNPTEGQSLEKVKDLLLNEINKLKSGNFSEDIITSIINNAKKEMIYAEEDYGDRAYQLMDNFVLGTDWLDRINMIERLSKISKQDIVDFANRYFKENYVVIYKRKGEDNNVVKVEKPAITPVTVNREDQSEFVKYVASIPENEIKPVWVDFNKDIQRETSGNYEVLAVKNENNELFSLTYHIETGSWSNKLLSLAAGYIDYIGTKNKNPEDISMEFYDLASSFSINVSPESTEIYLEGLQENFEKTVSLFDELLHNCLADKKALKAYIQRIQKSRQNRKENKNQIMYGLRNYAMFGEKNPFNQVLSNDELKKIKAEDLITCLRTLANYPHQILYYGPKSAKEIVETLNEVHKAPAQFLQLPPKVDYPQIDQNENQVLIAHFDMVQAEIFWIRNEDKYQEELLPKIQLFNQYFGGGMESIVFQTIRESKALAYSTYAYYATPDMKIKRNSFYAYIGTQADKFTEAVDGMNELLTELPQSKPAFENAKSALQKQLASERIIDEDILTYYLRANKLGQNYDVRKMIYDKLIGLELSDITDFHKEQISEKAFTYCIVAGEGKINQEKLNQLGKVKTLSLKEIFGY
ncbi:MAG: insulinase family protein [Brumimicrobium sp.]|nr:insulinase family protein [Brumimicrobium sp.]